jgi:hypothetical protein
MDAQGHEGHILRGATSLTALGVPVVMELDPPALARHGGLGYVRDVALGRYTHFVSMRRVRSRAHLHFDLEPIDNLDEEIDWLTDNSRFTDVLLLRDPRRRPFGAGPPRRPTQPRTPAVDGAEPTRAPLRAPDRIPARERAEFAEEARALTPVVATRVDGATFIVRTSAGPDELSLFVDRTHPHLELLAGATAALDELGFGNECRSKTFVQASAGVGVATVTALCRSGFARGLACEPDLGVYRMLKLNVAVNGLRERVRTLPVGLDGEPAGESLDGLLSRGVFDPGETGLISIVDEDAARTLAGAVNLLANSPPLLLRFGQKDDAVTVGLLAETHTHYVPLNPARQAVALADWRPHGHVLVVCLP